MPSLFQWLRGLFVKLRRKPSFGPVRRENGEGQVKGKLTGLSMLSLLGKRSTKYTKKDEDGWTTIFLDEDSDWMSDSDDSMELRPVISTPKPPILPKFVKMSEGKTDLSKTYQLQRNVGQSQETAVGKRRTLEEVPLAEIDCSRHLLHVAGIDGIVSDEVEEQEGQYGYFDDNVDNERDHDKLVSTGSSNISILSLMQRKYENRVKRRLKYEALHELTARARHKLRLGGISAETPSYSSLTSDGGDFKLNLPGRFYENIGFTSTRADERRRSMTFPWIKEVTRDIQKKSKDPASYLLSKWLGSTRPRIFRPQKSEYN